MFQDFDVSTLRPYRSEQKQVQYAENLLAKLTSCILFFFLLL